MSLKRLRHLLRVVNSDYYCDSPRQIDIELSNRCNLHCGMCWFHGERGVGDRYRGQEMTTAEVCGLVDQLADQHAPPELYLGGGEPFVRQDFLPILRHIKARALCVSFTTNGTLAGRSEWEALVAFGADYVNFSIDGGEELHDARRGSGVFQKVTESLRQLAAARENQRRAKPVITVNITVTDGLVGRLKETLQAIRESTGDAADFYRIHHQWFVSAEELSAHRSLLRAKLGVLGTDAEAHLVDASRIPAPRAIADEIETVRCEAKVVMFPDLSHAGIVNYYSRSPRIRRRCQAPLSRVVIKPNGDVVFCPDAWIDDYILGNVREESFRGIWNNEKARKFRCVLIREKRFPGCTRCSWMYAC